MHDKMCTQKIDRVRECTIEVLQVSNFEEKNLRQRTKLDWLKYGDDNNTYSHAYLKKQNEAESNQYTLYTWWHYGYWAKWNWRSPKILYGTIVGENARNFKGPQLSMEQCRQLTMPVIDVQILLALKGIKDITVPGVDGYGAKLFKAI